MEDEAEKIGWGETVKDLQSKISNLNFIQSNRKPKEVLKLGNE